MSQKSGTTTSLKQHAELLHAKEWKEISQEDCSQQKITDICKSSIPIKKYPLKSARRRLLNRKLVRHIAKDMRPLNTVNLAGFRDFCLEMDPMYVLPSRKTLTTKLIPKIHQEVMAGVQRELNKTRHCSLTTDGWSSKATDKYNAFTVHYVNWEIGELKSKVLECCSMEERGFSENLAKEITKVTEKYNIKNKIALGVADNAPDIQKALDLAGITKLGCFAHKFNLSAKFAIDNTEEIQDLKSKLSKIVRLTKVSPNAKKSLREYQRRVGYTGKNISISICFTN